MSEEELIHQVRELIWEWKHKNKTRGFNEIEDLVINKHNVTCINLLYEEIEACPYPDLIPQIEQSYEKIVECIWLNERNDCMYCRTLRYENSQ